MELISTLPGEVNYEDFIKVPKALYPLDIVGQAEFAHIHTAHLVKCYYVKDGDRLVGSIALYHNPAHVYKNQRACVAGYFHCINNTNACRLLVNAIKKDAEKLQVQFIIGPMNGSTWETYRFKTSDTQQPFFLEMNHPVYYTHLFETAGFKAIQTYNTYRVTALTEIPSRIADRKKQLQTEGIRIRTINPKNYEEELRSIYNLSVESFKNNLLYTPYSLTAFIEKYKLIEPYVRPDMIRIAENKNNEPVGFIFAIHDVLCSTHKQFVVKTYAVKSGIKYAGLGAVLLADLTDYLVKDGYSSALHAFVISDGVSANASSKGSEIYRTYQLYALEV